MTVSRIALSCLALVGLACATAKTVAAAQTQIPGSPQAPRPTPTDGSNRWFSETKKNLGTYFQHEKAHGEFQFKNPNDFEVTLTGLTQSCACSHTEIQIGEDTYRLERNPKPDTLYKLVQKDGAEALERADQILVPPGAEGVVKVVIDVNNTKGKRTATLDMHTSDTESPHLRLQFEAIGTSLFQIQPPDFNLGRMTWKETREFTFRITSQVEKDFEITGHEPLADGFTVETKKEMNGEFATWVVTGTFGPLTSERSGGGIVKLNTNVRGGKQVELRVHAVVEGPLTMEPGGYLSLGRIKKGEGITKSLRIIPNDDFDLQAESIGFEGGVDESLVTISSRKDGKALVIDLEVSKDAPAKHLIRGEILVKLNHPAVSERRILFSGFVR